MNAVFNAQQILKIAINAFRQKCADLPSSKCFIDYGLNKAKKDPVSLR